LIFDSLVVEEPTEDGVSKGAAISPDGKYRYYLDRWWEEGKGALVFVMLNPSTADHRVDDPTIKRCMAFARALGYGGIIVLNLFALRSSQPADLDRAIDPIGPQNDEYLDTVLRETAVEGGAVIVAWGTNGARERRDEVVLKLIRSHGLTPLCFGETKDGHPKHPLARGKHRIPDGAVPQAYAA
jgi:hypothetical protein